MLRFGFQMEFGPVSPLEVGVHVRSLYSVLTESQTRQVLPALEDDRRLLDLLKRQPLGRLEFSGNLPNQSWRGSYDLNSRDLVVNPFRDADTYGKEFHPPELPTVSEAATGLIEALQRTLYHELGHVVLDAGGPELQLQVRNLFRSRRAMPVSLRAAQNSLEYFCETFSAYRFEAVLADKDPNGYDMIEAILRLVFK